LLACLATCLGSIPASPCGISARNSSNGMGLSPHTSILSCHGHYIFLPILQFSPVMVTIYQGIKFNFSLSTPQRHIEGVEVRLLSSLTLAPRDMSVQMNTLAALPQERTLVPIEYEGGWGPRAFLNALERSLFPLPGLEPWTWSLY